MIWGFSIKLNWFPVQGYKSIFKDGFIPFIKHITLPTVALGLFYIALIARITRATVIEILSEDYIRTAYAKGLIPKIVLYRHALKNASVPIVTIIGIAVGKSGSPISKCTTFRP